MAVVRLGAFCDLVDPVVLASPTVSFSVGEFVELSDGTTVTLHNERGFSETASAGFWTEAITAESVRSDVLTTVLPDDDDGEPHPWDWLAQLAADRGVDTTVEELREVPYEVVFSVRLSELLAQLRQG